ncbi:MAG: hypothetical protein LBD41_04960 [Clostridiales Family XIII bacterium]|jgi:DNA ligase (NAD+)|nr:hypothetical protein [Clostridiales Family XIII bacterium]
MTELEEKIIYYQQKYYDGEPEIEDAEFDLLWDTLALQQPNSSLLKSVGKESQNLTFKKVPHIMKMGSQNKATTEEDFVRWFNKQNEKTFVIEHKLDGLSIELQYINGKLVHAVTR